MIIPPDPEKDPRLFDPSSSTPSLILAPSEYDDTTSRWDGDAESLPPYRRSRGSISSQASHASSSQNEETSIPHRIIIPTTSTPNHLYLDHASPISSTGSLTPTLSRSRLPLGLPHFNDHSLSPSTTLQGSNSSSKLWEGSSAPEKNKKRKCGCLPTPSPGMQRWWAKWRRWVQAVMVVILVGIGLAVGLLVGMNKAKQNKAPAPWQKPWMAQDTDGKRATAWAGNGSFNLTYDSSRDGPSSAEGTLSDCNSFTSLNLTSSPFGTLFTAFPASKLSVASFSFPLPSSGNPPSDIFINSRGFGSSGSIHFLGSDGPEAVISSGQEGQILIDVVVRYSGNQDLNTMMKVCKMSRGSDGVGVGIYSPTETDGKLFNIFKLNPNLVPTNLVIIRLPPSLFSGHSPALEFPSFSVNSDHMAIRLGNLNNIASFDSLNLTTYRGTVTTNYVQTKNAVVTAVEGDVKGIWNVSDSLLVNITEGSIVSDLILHDPNIYNDNATTLSSASMTDYTLVSRNASPDDDGDGGGDMDVGIEDEIHSLLNCTSTNATSNGTLPIITTNLFTSSGYVNVRYLHQPTSISLSAILATQEGDMNIVFNPNYVGPFLTKNHWGQINIKTPSPIRDSDPKSLQRSRQIIIDPIEVLPNSTFYTIGYTTEDFDDSPDTLSGVVYWADTKPNGKPILRTIEQVQADQSIQNNQLIIMGSWGDVEISFDGQ
ncbi:uncharacterized protein IL334_006913 [Kwoniella shivajii]|uniref:Uncharacterized protein n=1 Tax=Kwoniella shivajii TaxID=564305 RepID=A0ABZ1D7B9_9TREE|nr:hypothetical protein IL334_006913 [Kwoniella shivajii]